MEEENSLYYSHQKLQNLIVSNSGKRPEEVVIKFFRESNFAPIPDFQKGAEWFNVSRPLSLESELKRKLVLLDFFTYCCINCMHILPELKEIEEEFTVDDGFVVVGVHSAKFENEKSSANVLNAVQRYNINHPVINDKNSEMWRRCEVHCWPTLLLIGPNRKPLVMMMGEGHKEHMRLYISAALECFKDDVSKKDIPLHLSAHLIGDASDVASLKFPGKVAYHNGVLAVSDSGNNRILLIENGKIIKIIGNGGLGGRKDGTLSEAKFNNPQGLTFAKNKDVIYVADTDNHAIRKIDLIKGLVTTVAGRGGIQGNDYKGGAIGEEQVISSPWDVALYGNILLIAMAGTHQIWGLFIEETKFWKGKVYEKGTVVNLAGSGREENRNNSYPANAAFAQPSGLTINEEKAEMYLADSESSAIRKVSLLDGKVSAVVGGDRNPSDLFAFGDVDGVAFNAKLQHPLGVAYASGEVYVCDTYNHKIKIIDVEQNSVRTLSNLGTFNEPGGICVGNNDEIYVADTNNHCIKRIKHKSNVEILKFDMETSIDGKVKRDTVLLIRDKVMVNSNDGRIELKLILDFVGGLTLTANAPNKCTLDMKSKQISGSATSDSQVAFSTFIMKCNGNAGDDYIDVNYNLITCMGDICLPKRFVVRQPIELGNKFPEMVSCSAKVEISMNDFKLL
ncbi:PREDICTED: NHL repeat-containing protein 2 [Nicrophorus vespilloides]|uniref:NHL repeat-containing protein 2 n=1 Tax=Nicrophorus vespilloides TaxID=110193 RepID=A0ABM1M6Y8_NICVS|nr:PREDICTED: NHL repeat-containing protein 2 [Nicrophorus vespilloides]